MVEEITITIGDSFAQRHQSLSEDLGADYDERMRMLVENEIHTITQEIERQAEKQTSQLEIENQ